MKKVVLFSIIILLVTGCKGKDELTCSGTTYNEDDVIKNVMTIKIKDKKVDNISSKMSFKDKDASDRFCNLYNLVSALSEEELSISCKDKEVVINDYKTLEKVLGDYSEEKFIGISKKDIKKLMKQKGYSCK